MISFPQRPIRYVISVPVVLILFSAVSTLAQSPDYGYDEGEAGGEYYQDYADPYGQQQDNLYADYASHQNEKLQGGGGGYVGGFRMPSWTYCTASSLVSHLTFCLIRHF